MNNFHYIRLLVIGAFSILSVTILYLSSEKNVRFNNAFVRRLPHHPIVKKHSIDLGYNSYYISGHKDSVIYLGNSTAPLHLLKVNYYTKDTSHISISLEKLNLEYRNILVKILEPYFFVMDGTSPFIFRGETLNWQATSWLHSPVYFDRAIPVDSNKIMIRTIDPRTSYTELAIVSNEEDSTEVGILDDFLVKQIDGNFDVDGVMAFSETNNRVGYIYYYRNSFMIFNTHHNSFIKQNTIDTISKAQIKIAQAEVSLTRKMVGSPLIVNKGLSLYKDLVFVLNPRLGKYEDPQMLNQAYTVDVYDTKKHSYEFSFYLYFENENKPREFKVVKNHLLALVGNQLIVYDVDRSRFRMEKKTL